MFNSNVKTPFFFLQKQKKDAVVFNKPLVDKKNLESLYAADTPCIALQIHIYFTDLLEEMLECANRIPFAFDCYISTDSEEKKGLIEEQFVKKCKAKKCEVRVFPNRGKDVAPFLLQMRGVISQYKYIGHIHTKKAEHVEWGDHWRRYLLSNVCGSEEYLENLFQEFEQNESLGFVMPEIYPLMKPELGWGEDQGALEQHLTEMGLDLEIPMEPVFPSGSMFWAKVDAVLPIFQLSICSDDFAKEGSHTHKDLTFEIEQLWCVTAMNQGYDYLPCLNRLPIVNAEKEENNNNCCIFMHYNHEGKLDQEDVESIALLKNDMNHLMVISNSALSEEDQERIKVYADEVIVRENEGYDFGGWKHGIQTLGWDAIESYDALYLTNNSCLGPIGDLQSVICQMKEHDFWGITEYPRTASHDFPGRDYIPAHIQSYFVCFNKKVIASQGFQEFWNQLKTYSDYASAVSFGELALTEALVQAGFSYASFVPESKYIGELLHTSQPQNECGYEYLVLGAPFIKKKTQPYSAGGDRRRIRHYMQYFNHTEAMQKYYDRPRRMDATIVIPTKNGGERLDDCLRAIFAQVTKYEYEVICVDSGSKDDTLDTIAKYPCKLYQIPASEFGHGKTRNYGASKGTGKYILFVTQDAVPASYFWLNSMLDAMRSDPEIVAGFGPHYPYADCNLLDKKDLKAHFANFGSKDTLYYIDDEERYKKDEGYRHMLAFFSDNNSCVRRDIFEKYPYEDVNFAEDQIWMRAMIEKGYKKIYCPAAPVYHSHNYDIPTFYQRYYDEYKGIYEIHQFQISPYWLRLFPMWARHVLNDSRYIRSLPMGRKEKLYWCWYSFCRNYARYYAGYKGGRYHSYSKRKQQRLDKRISQQYRQRNA